MFLRRPIFGIQNLRCMMNYALLRLPFLTLFCLLLHTAGAQQCAFRLLLNDSYGDGWNGGVLTLTNGPTVLQLSLSDGSDSIVTFTATNGTPVQLNWTPGNIDFEVSISLFNNDGDLLFSATDPNAGSLYNIPAVCIACLKPLNVVIENVYDTYAKVRWSPAVGTSLPVGWWVIYDSTGFTPGPGKGDSLYVILPKATIPGLAKKNVLRFLRTTRLRQR